MWKYIKCGLKTEKPSYSLFSITFSFCLFFSLSLQQNQNTNAYRERERDGCCSRSDIGRVSSVSIWLSSTWKPILATPCWLSPPQAPPFQNPYGIFLSLSSSTSLFFAQYIITTVLGFLWFEVYKLFFIVNYSIFMYL